MQLLTNYADNHYNGYAVKQWLTDNADISAYISIAYMAFVFKGPDVVAKIFGGKPPVALLKKAWVAWNLLLVVFSLYGSMLIAPVLIHHFRTYGMRETLCTLKPEEYYTGSIGLAMGAFAISKLPEFGDTFFLIMMGKRKLPFLSWFHHVTIFLYAWYAYQEGSSIFIIVASMNYPVHTIMYFYFAMAEAGYKNLVRPFAKYITMLQIAQMIGGLYMTTSYMRYHMADPEKCNGASMSMTRGQLMIYLCNFYLFSEMFVKNYVLVRRTTGHKQE